MAKDKEPVSQEEDINSLKATVASLIGEVKRLQNPGMVKRVEKVREHFATLRVWENQLVVRVGQVRDNYGTTDPNGKQSLDVTLVNLDGKQTEASLPYLFWLENAPTVPVKILTDERTNHIATEKDPDETGARGGGWAMKAGTINYDKEGIMGAYSNNTTGELIPLEVMTQIREITAEVIEGPFKTRVFTFTNKTINTLNA